ncbi:MAG: LysR substrate-binding domain-containing protein [Pseudomonadota bacterium]
MISLKQLRYFDAVVRLGHFGKAADACSVTQPALSMQIQSLEADLGTSLLERTPTGVLPTPLGREIAEQARAVLHQVKNISDHAKKVQGTLTGSLYFGVIPSIAPYVLPPLLPLLRQLRPNLDLHIRETQTAQLLEELLDGTLDLLLMALPVNHKDLESLQLFEDRFVLAMPKDHKPSGKIQSDPSLLDKEDLLLLEEGHCMRDQAIELCRLQRSTTLNSFGAASLTTIIQMVTNGMGLTLLPEMSLEVETKNKKLKLLRFDDPQPSRSIGLVWRKTSPRREDFLELGELIRRDQ